MKKYLLTLLLLVVCPLLMLGQTAVPSSYFGMHTINVTSHWPTVKVGAMRPAGVSWGAIETSRGVYNWSYLDTWVNAAAQHGVPLNYLFLNVPKWASSNPTQNCYNGYVGCAAPVKDLAMWDEFVNAIATRYKGRIQSYELWNEPNDVHYWTGTTAQLVEMSRRAYTAIHSIDPQATVLTPSPTWTSVTAWSWLDGYFTAGGAAYADVVAYHGYTGTSNAESVLTIINNVKNVMHTHGVAKPQWVTEGGWGTSTYVSDRTLQADFLAQRYLLIWSYGVSRFYWYQWDNPNWGTLWDSTNGIRPAGTAYGELYQWMVGNTLSSPCTKDSTNTWRCEFTRADGSKALAVWNRVSSTSIIVPSGYTDYRDLNGNVTAINSSTVAVDGSPKLLESTATTTAPPAPAPTPAPTRSMTILSPLNGTTTGTTVLFESKATSPQIITFCRLYVDYKSVWSSSVSYGHIKVTRTVSSRKHNANFQCWDNTGANMKAVSVFTAQ